MPNTATSTRPATLTRADRCERCGAAAMVRVTTENLGVWLFCKHHWRQHATALPGIVHIHDETDPL